MAFYRKKVISFFINEECNMRCIYCPIHSDTSPVKHIPQVIDSDFAKLGIDDYFNNDFFNKEEKKGIRIFSNGEATLEFERMREIVDYAHEKSDNNLFVEMQTNGYFNDKVADWIKGNVDLLWVSFDGLADIHNKQRLTMAGGSNFNIVDRNIKKINESNRTEVGLRATISEYNLHRQKELVDYAVENRLAAVYSDPWGSMMEVEGQPDFMEFADEFLRAWQYARRKNMVYGTEVTVNFDEETEIYCRSCLPAPQFTPDGYVSSCDMVNTGNSFLAQLFPELIFGYYDKKAGRIHYNREHKNKIKSRNIYNLKDCQGCEALKHCAGGCIGLAMSASLDFYGKNKKYCALTKYLYKRMQSAVNTGYDKNIPIHP